MSELLTTVRLPSKGLLNPEDPVYGGPITLDMMGFEQEKMVFGSNADNVLDKMLKSVIKTEGVDLDQLTPFDKHYLLVQERIHSYGDEYHIKYQCPYCGVEEEHVIDLNDIPVIELPDDFVEPIEGTLPLCGKKVGVKLLRQKDRKAIDNEIRLKADKLKKNPQDLRYELRFVKSIVTIDGEQPNVGEREALVRSLKGRDLAYLDHLIKKTVFGYAAEALTTCSSCGENFEVPFVMTSEFFRPRFD
jgi:hypothetical protein